METVSMSSALSDYFESQQKRRESLPQRSVEIAKQLAAVGVVTVTANYDGCGDSGQIDSIIFNDGDKEVEDGKVPAELSQEVEDFLYDVLETRHGGWENNDGADGEFTWCVAETLKTDAEPGAGIEHTHNSRYTEVDTSSHSGL